MLAPERKDELNPNDGWERIYSKLRSVGDLSLYADMLITALLLSPERRSELPIDDKLWDSLLNLIESYRNPRNWHEFANACRQAAILFPERRNELSITAEEWNGMKKKAKSKKAKKSHLYQMAMCTAVIAADEISITNAGLIIEHPEKTLHQTPNLPDRSLAS